MKLQSRCRLCCAFSYADVSALSFGSHSLHVSEGFRERHSGWVRILSGLESLRIRDGPYGGVISL